MTTISTLRVRITASDGQCIAGHGMKPGEFKRADIELTPDRTRSRWRTAIKQHRTAIIFPICVAANYGKAGDIAVSCLGRPTIRIRPRNTEYLPECNQRAAIRGRWLSGNVDGDGR